MFLNLPQMGLLMYSITCFSQSLFWSCIHDDTRRPGSWDSVKGVRLPDWNGKSSPSRMVLQRGSPIQHLSSHLVVSPPTWHSPSCPRCLRKKSTTSSGMQRTRSSPPMTYPLSHVKVFCVSWLNESVVLKRCEEKSALKPAIKQMLIFF